MDEYKSGNVIVAILIIIFLLASPFLGYLIFSALSEQPTEIETKSVHDLDEMPIVVEPMAEEEEPEPKPVVKETYSEPVVQEYVEPESAPQQTYAGNGFESDGVWQDENYRYTWYSSNVLYHYRTPEWTAGSDGIYRDSEGYVVVASSDHPQGTIIENTPFGAVKVYDSGCASGTLDVYTNF